MSKTVLPKNTTQCPRPGLEQRPLDLETSALTNEATALPTIIAKAALVIYSMSKHRASESLLTQNYSFILAIKCIGTSIFRTDKVCYKMFDSRVIMVEAIPSGTCELLEVPSIQSLVQYFQRIQL